MEFNRESQELEAEIRDLEGQLYYRADSSTVTWLRWSAL
jgi:hypothetical protein